MCRSPGLLQVAALGCCASYDAHPPTLHNSQPKPSPPRLLASGSQDLLVAACTGDVERVREEGVNSLVFLYDWTVLHEACQWGQVGVVQELLRQGGVNICKQV